MQDDQKDPLPICANDTIKVPLWLNTAAFPGFSLKVIKLEKTIYIQMLKTNLSHWFWNVPVCQDLVLLWPYMVTERQKSDSAYTLAAWANVSPKRKKVGQFTFNWTCMNVTESVRADKKNSAQSTWGVENRSVPVRKHGSISLCTIASVSVSVCVGGTCLKWEKVWKVD